MRLVRQGSRGDFVRAFQEFLIEKGFLSGAADGVAGPVTARAIRHFQEKSLLIPDGVAGPQTLKVAATQGFSWDRKPTAPQAEAALETGIPVDVIQAIEAVESNGAPTAIRFEPHVFHRRRPDLASKVPFTRGPRGFSVLGEETDQSAFERAFELDPEAAVASTSWGLYQVMGHPSLLELHNNDPVHAADSFYAEPEAVSYRLLARWFKGNPRALTAAKERNWRRLARYYNGPGQVDYYERALRKAHEGIVG